MSGIFKAATTRKEKKTLVVPVRLLRSVLFHIFLEFTVPGSKVGAWVNQTACCWIKVLLANQQRRQGGRYTIQVQRQRKIMQ